jgi:hypothetical protein
MAVDIVDSPIDSMVIFHSYVSLPEGMGIAAKNAINATKTMMSPTKQAGTLVTTAC